MFTNKSKSGSSGNVQSEVLPNYDTTMGSLSTPQREEALVSVWKEENIFKQGIKRQDAKNFVTYDGPPFATGVPHYGHLLAMTIKDTFASYQALNGKDVTTLFGWDCHGVPIEHLIQKKFQLKDKQDIFNHGIRSFNEECRKTVFTCEDQWHTDTTRLGRFIDMENSYKTMDPNYMESIWWVFNELNRKGLIYESKKIVAFSPALGTTLSDFEAKLNYKDVRDPAITMEFPLVEDPSTCLLVWTTTPWSVPANVAVAVNQRLDHVRITNKETNKKYILQRSLAENFFNLEDSNLFCESFLIETILGKHYYPMFDTLPDNVDQIQRENSYKIVHSDHVTNASGSGCVHICPAYGEDDFSVGTKYQLPCIDFIDDNGKFLTIYDKKVLMPVAERFFKEADQELIGLMQQKGRMYKIARILHSYPFCWRTESPLMYRAVNSWYVKVTAIKSLMVENNLKVNWHPENIGHHRFQNWLENAHDWAISRSRFWGNPIPVWRNMQDPNDVIFVQSRQELSELTGLSINDLHRHHIDELLINKNGKTYKRIPEVFDCWFESGSMPYAQVHYPYGCSEEEFLNKHFPADFIAEGIDQTRGWFYALTVIGNALFGKPPFKNVIVNGILLGNDNKKMSKSIGNFPPISEVFDKYGADAIRFMLLSSPAAEAQEVAIQNASIQQAHNKIVIRLINIYKFFAESANLAKKFNLPLIDINEYSVESTLDKWFIYATESFKKKIKSAYDEYRTREICESISQYIDHLSGWYIRHSRERIKTDPKSVLTLLHYSLDTLSRYAAPIIPFITDNIYRALYNNKSSVHLGQLSPIYDVSQYREDFSEMENLRKIIDLGVALREASSIRLRQPMPGMYMDIALKESIEKHAEFLKEVLNVKEIQWITSSEEIADIFITLNHKVLGPQYKNQLKAILQSMKNKEYTLEGDMLTVNGITLDKKQNHFSMKFLPCENTFTKSDGDLWIVLNAKLTPELIQEGYLRDFIRAVQNQRKVLKFKKDEKVVLIVSDSLKPLLNGFEGLIIEKTNVKICYQSGLNGKEFPMHNIHLGPHQAAIAVVSKNQYSQKELKNKSFFEMSTYSNNPVKSAEIDSETLVPNSQEFESTYTDPYRI